MNQSLDEKLDELVKLFVKLGMTQEQIIELSNSIRQNEILVTFDSKYDSLKRFVEGDTLESSPDYSSKKCSK